MVVRVADKIVVDLMLAAGGTSYEETVGEVQTVILQGVPIPFAPPTLPLWMKKGFVTKTPLVAFSLETRLQVGSKVDA